MVLVEVSIILREVDKFVGVEMKLFFLKVVIFLRE